MMQLALWENRWGGGDLGSGKSNRLSARKGGREWEKVLSARITGKTHFKHGNWEKRVCF